MKKKNFLKKTLSVTLASCLLGSAVSFSSKKVKASILGNLYNQWSQNAGIGDYIVVGSFIPPLYKLLKWASTEFFNDMSAVGNWFSDRFIYDRHKLNSDPIEFRRTASRYLNENVFAQKQAVDKIVDTMSGYIDASRQSYFGGISRGSCVMTFIGGSGTGKTYTARLLSQLLFGKDIQPWQYITKSSVKPPISSSNEKYNINIYNFGEKKEELPPADRLFNSESPLIMQLERNNEVIVVIDEIDKIHEYDPTDTILERLRDAKDTGTLRVRVIRYDGKEVHKDIDVSRTIFILASNEKRECWGLPKLDLPENELVDRTYVNRDRSLVNRFYTIEFARLKAKDYAVILDKMLKIPVYDYIQNYNVHIDFSNDFIEKISNRIEEKNQGVRGLNDYLLLLRGSLINWCLQNNISKENKKEVKVTADYDTAEDSFRINKKLIKVDADKELKKLKKRTKMLQD